VLGAMAFVSRRYDGTVDGVMDMSIADGLKEVGNR